jgi:hypothetical protein
VSTPLPDDLPPPRRRMEPETPAQHAERMRLIAERRVRDVKRTAAWLAERNRLAKLARIAGEAAAPDDTPQ